MSGGVEISQAAIYEAVTATREDVARILTRLDLGLKDVADLKDRVRVMELAPKVPPAQAADQEERLRRLEERWWKLAGALVVLSVLVSAVVAFLSHAGLVKAG